MHYYKVVKMRKKYGALSKVRHAGVRAKLGVIGGATATLCALTLGYAAHLYRHFNKVGAWERIATALYIGKDTSMDRIRNESDKLHDYNMRLHAARQDLNNYRAAENANIEARIAMMEKDKETGKAAELRGIHDQLIDADKQLRGIYDGIEDKLETIASVPTEQLDQYSTLWRRTVKVNAFLTYEVVTYAKARVDEITKKGGIEAWVFENVVKRGLEAWAKYVLGAKEEDLKNKYEALRGRILAYTKAEIEKQGLGNFMESFNEFMDQQNLSEAEKDLYLVVRDSINETGDNVLALQMLDYIEHGKLPPKGLDGIEISADTRQLIEAQKDIVDKVTEAYKIVINKVALIDRAERLGIAYEKSNLQDLDQLSESLDVLSRDIEKSQQELLALGVQPKDPNYLALIDKLKLYYWGAVSAVCLLQLAAGAFVGRSAIHKNKFYNLQREYDALAGENASLQARIDDITQPN